MAKKDTTRDSLLREGSLLLDQWGISLARLQDQSLSITALTERVGQQPAADLALAALLGEYPTREAAQALLEWEAKTSDKNARKEIHRSLYKLSQKGITPERPVEEPVRRPILAPSEPEGYLSPIDGRGDRLVWLIKPKVGGGVHYLAAVINEPEGMQHSEGAEITRKGFRAMRDDIETRFRLLMVEVAWRYCDWLMHEGYERARTRGRTNIEDYPALRSHVVSSPAQQVAIPFPPTIEPEAIAADDQLLTTSVELFQEPEFQRWFLDHEHAHRYTEQISQVQESPLILNRYQQQDRLQSVIEKAIDELFSGEQGAVYVRRLEESALYLANSGRNDAAKRALAVALALKWSERGGKGIPFCEELVRQSIMMHYQEERQQGQEESSGSLIMKPSEFAARVQAAQRQRMMR
ncbi:MAG: hypothetical protein AB7G75_15770 [Candidatus Binatia bacterium]